MDATPDAATVEAWIRRAGEGDDEAFDRLARHALPRLRRWALVRTGDADDADEVVQRTLVAVHRTIHDLRDPGAFDGWLHRIVQHAAAGLERSHGSRRDALRRMAEEPERPELGAGPADPDAAVERAEARELVRAFLGELSPRQREVLDLVDLQGYAPAEVAERTGLEGSTVRVHLLRARRALRARILDGATATAGEAGPHPTRTTGTRDPRGAR